MDKFGDPSSVDPMLSRLNTNPEDRLDPESRIHL